MLTVPPNTPHAQPACDVNYEEKACVSYCHLSSYRHEGFGYHEGSIAEAKKIEEYREPLDIQPKDEPPQPELYDKETSKQVTIEEHIEGYGNIQPDTK